MPPQQSPLTAPGVSSPQPPSPPVAPPSQQPSQPPRPQQIPPVGQTPVNPMPQRNGLPTWVKVVGGIIAAIVIFFILFFVVIFTVVNSATKNAVKVSDKFIADVQANNPTAAWDLTDSDFKNNSSISRISHTFNNISPQLQGSHSIINKSVGKNSGEPETAVIIYSVKTSAGTKYFKILLVKHDNDTWQVDGYGAYNRRPSSSTGFSS